MSAVHVLRPVRRGLAPLAVSLALTALGALPAAAERDMRPAGQDRDEPRPAGILLAQADGGAGQVSPYQEPAPNLFEATGTAVWDGKRTLQGVWVAHPMATSARRVRIYNGMTGAAVDGALFKRDPALTGPSVLVSSEAAQFLGMQPGEEVELRIVAVTPSQRPAVADEPAAPAQPTASSAAPAAASTAGVPAAVPDAASPGTADAAPAAQTPVAQTPAVQAPAAQRPAAEAPADAAARQEPAELASVPEPAPEAAASPTRVPAPRPQTPGPAATPTVRSPSLRAENTAPGEGSGGGAVFQLAPLADRDQPSATAATVRLAEPAAGALAPAPSRPVFQAAPPGSSVSVPPAAPAALPARDSAAGPGAIRPQGMDAGESGATPLVPEPAARVAAIEPAPATAVAEPAAGPVAGTLPRPYVQAGIFGVRDNADRLIGRLKAADLPALGKPIQLSGKTMTRVLVGPFTGAAERDAALARVREMGLRDAAPVTR